ncbi:MAG: hypothetical protein EXX96DRAFT_649137 [Benjaminiella poitrasii]|nr:MAG: hypothetical protein EXX96DRAFT_649137 [Benjaminiella poitrasii]
MESGIEQPELSWWNVSQASTAVIFAVIIILFFIYFSIALISLFLGLKLEWSLVISGIRCVLQLSLTGLVLNDMLQTQHMSLVIGMSVLLVLLATYETVCNRTKKTFRGIFSLMFIIMFVSNVLISYIGCALVLKADPFWDPPTFIPVIGMLLGNSMSSVAMAVERCLDQFSLYGPILETRLSYGASRYEASLPLAVETIRMALLPVFTQLSVMGMINIPGMMTGQIMAGTPIMQAVMYQQCIMFMVAASSTLGVVMSVVACLSILIDHEQVMRYDRIQDNKSLYSYLKRRRWFMMSCNTPSEAEKFMLNFPSTKHLRSYLKTYTSKVHLAGTANDRDQAEWTHAQFQHFGLQSDIATYWPMLTYPIKQRLALVTGPAHLQFEAKLDEAAEDGSSDETVPTFHGYSKNGTVRGRVVYAHYGRPQDFEFLATRGVQLKGTIALVRHGQLFRGLKVRAAEQAGCVGVLIYSDPRDDGAGRDATYPRGPWRPADSVQRGSVQFMPLVSGDPLTPGYPATQNATRIRPEEAVGLPTIPSLPLSWQDARPLLRATEGRGVQVEVADDVRYFSGPTEGEAVLVNWVESKIAPVWNVIGRVEGTSNETVVLGNHRDAWGFGAVDPSSGSATLLELARALGGLVRVGWRPRRSIVLASWDAEEYGLVGSTEWVEDHREWLRQSAVAYLNVDYAVSGPLFGAQASPSLARLLHDVTALVADPGTTGSVLDRWRLRNDALVGALGSGSDFVPFFNHVGVASVNMAFRGEYGVYHSIYDSFRWMQMFGDPEFLYHQAMVRVWGLLTMRLADAEVVPIDVAAYADRLETYVDTLEDQRRRRFSLLKSAVRSLKRAVQYFERHLGDADDVNERLMCFERGLLDEDGLPGRKWFKHVVFAPGLWTGYTSQVFPAIAEAMEEGDEEHILYAEERTARAIQRTADKLIDKNKVLYCT